MVMIAKLVASLMSNFYSQHGTFSYASYGKI